VGRPAFAGLLAAFLAVVFSAACTTLPRSGGQQPLPTPEQLQAFQLNGRINLRVEKEGFPGRVRWTHAPDRDELWFYSPIGTTVAHLVQDEHGALLVTAKGEEHRSSDLHTLAADVLGWDLPLAGLPFWVRGLPWPDAEVSEEQRDAQGRLTQLQQGGWTVSYLDWGSGGAQALPAKLDLKGERLRLRLLIERWTAGNAS
jgi:outer membrane lipoprotein LolB